MSNPTLFFVLVLTLLTILLIAIGILFIRANKRARQYMEMYEDRREEMKFRCKSNKEKFEELRQQYTALCEKYLQATATPKFTSPIFTKEHLREAMLKHQQYHGSYTANDQKEMIATIHQAVREMKYPIYRELHNYEKGENKAQFVTVFLDGARTESFTMEGFIKLLNLGDYIEAPFKIINFDKTTATLSIDFQSEKPESN